MDYPAYSGGFGSYPGASHPPPPPYSAYNPYMAQPSYPAYPHRQYYMIRCRMNGLVLDIEGMNTQPGARVILWTQKGSDNSNQLWYDDPFTGTIRSKLNDFCLDMQGNNVVMMPFRNGCPGQQWIRYDPFIQNRAIPTKVLDVLAGISSPGAHIIAYDKHGGINQQFDCQFIPISAASTPSSARPRFFIISEMNGKVLDVSGGNPGSGAEVIMWPRKPGNESNQLWYFDNEGVIHSALNDFVLEASTDGSQIRMMPHSGSPNQRWTIVGNRIMKNKFECLDIKGERSADGAKVISYRYKASSNQHWRLEYV